MATSKAFKVLVCGGRDFAEAAWLSDVLTDVWRRDAGWGDLVVIEGGARGADSLARHWAMRNGRGTQGFRADWSLGKRAGPLRNQRMLDEAQPDLVIAFPGGRGTADMVRRARAAGVEVREMQR